MPTLTDLSPHTDWHSLGDICFNALKLDSRAVNQGDAFVLLKSAVNHDDARSAGYAAAVQDVCAFILSEIDLSTADISAPWLHVPHIRAILGDLKQAELQAKRACKLPKVIAVTGTNGKTTVATLIAQLFTACGKKAALLGTAGNGMYPSLTQASHTTSDVFCVHEKLHEFGIQGADVLCLEASSHGLDQNRLQGVPIVTAIYTNLSRDHLDYHVDMAGYARAKAKLFAFQSLSHAIINVDDGYAKMMSDAAQDAENNAALWRYTTKDVGEAGAFTYDFYIDNAVLSSSGISGLLNTPSGTITLASPLLGAFNLANLMAAIAAGLAQELDLYDIEKAIPKLTGAAGRMQQVADVAPVHVARTFLVDYAHTPDALTKALGSLKQLDQSATLWVVFGCGGDRDTGKRLPMTKAALELADQLIITADNPRSESVSDIIKDMTTGLTTAEHARIHIEPDRKAAIVYAAHHAQAGDIVLIAGKGHETYQQIGGVRHEFDDVEVLRCALQAQTK